MSRPVRKSQRTKKSRFKASDSPIIHPSSKRFRPSLQPSSSPHDPPNLSTLRIRLHGRQDLCTLTPRQAKSVAYDVRIYGCCFMMRRLKVTARALSRARRGLSITKKVRDKLLLTEWKNDVLQPVVIPESSKRQDLRRKLSVRTKPLAPGFLTKVSGSLPSHPNAPAPRRSKSAFIVFR